MSYVSPQSLGACGSLPPSRRLRVPLGEYAHCGERMSLYYSRSLRERRMTPQLALEWPEYRALSPTLKWGPTRLYGLAAVPVSRYWRSCFAAILGVYPRTLCPSLKRLGMPTELQQCLLKLASSTWRLSKKRSECLRNCIGALQ
jgi:hypothetical protein